jgi:hypothetical protein
MNGSTVFIGIKSVEILVAVRFQNEGERFFQFFELSANKPVLRIASDKRYELYSKLNNKINETMLSNLSDNFTFVSKIEEGKNIIIEYSVNGKINKDLLINYFFVVSSFLPPYCGCDYCAYCNKVENGIYCDIKSKVIEPIKRCVVFYQKYGLFKT